MATKDIIVVQKKHIQAGIERYEGKPDEHLQQVLSHAGYDYKVYRFKDQRILLVLPHEISAVLYANEQVLYNKLSLD